ncbi:NADH:flavin oxidoreductase/NADH oxidase [Microdochium bolleyi]|uniref:NADH:flavin oxidoreductase/NADH oxidase n=1 Tax=Microdochium bolleyi TaxID=196109 RepID=A0A136JGH0_9PEZI|nr:NADH:flavin oxidoreductase/NADH oxidase [Microdochium bolleyi]
MTRLFQPLKVGNVELDHRIMLAPLTRYRCDDEWVPLPMVKEYYTQRAAVPGTLLVSEGTLISHGAAGRYNIPGIWSPAQIAAWKSIVESVHAKGGRIYCQLWHLGRSGWAHIHAEQGTVLLSSSAVPTSPSPSPTAPQPGVPEAMTEDQIQAVIAEYATAARNAVEGAGFDGVEIHGANGYLPDQFLQDTCNKRTDRWGGSVENRTRFALEVTKAVVAAVGAERTAIRLSPFNPFNGMLMEDPLPTFRHLLRELRQFRLAYLHLVEGRINIGADGTLEGQVAANPAAWESSLSALVGIWDNASPVLIAGGFTPELARRAVDEVYRDHDVGIVFGRHFVSNPDLVFRIKEGVEFVPYDRSVFYTPGRREGYVDYPFCEEFLASQAVAAAAS